MLWNVRKPIYSLDLTIHMVVVGVGFWISSVHV